MDSTHPRGGSVPTHRQRILNLLTEKGPLTQRRISILLTLDKRAVKQRLDALFVMNLVQYCDKLAVFVEGGRPVQCRYWRLKNAK